MEKGLELKGIEKQKLKRKFRESDSLANPAEELFKLTCNVYDKVYGSRSISPHMDLSSNVSDSFKVLISGINGLIKESWLFI